MVSAGRKNSPPKDFNKKVWENAKKALTNIGWFGILPKLSAAANAAAISTKKNLKNSKKCLTVLLRYVILIKLLRMTNGSRVEKL